MSSDLWYAVPLIVAVSLVYAATRHEAMDIILRHAMRTAFMFAAFMGIVMVVLAIISHGVL